MRYGDLGGQRPIEIKRSSKNFLSTTIALLGLTCVKGLRLAETSNNSPVSPVKQ